MGPLLRLLAVATVSTLTGEAELVPVACSNVTDLHLQLSWARLLVPVSFGSFHSSDDLRSMIVDVAQRMCDKHRAEHGLETPRCVREFTDKAFAAMATNGAEAVPGGEPRVLLGVRWGDRVIPAVVPADPCASTAAAWGFAERVGLPLEQAQRVADDLDALRGATSSRSPLLGAPDASLPSASPPAAREVDLDVEAGRAAQPPTLRLCVCLFGRLGNMRGKSRDGASSAEVLDVVVASHVRFLREAAIASFGGERRVVVDLVAHSWEGNNSLGAAIDEAYSRAGWALARKGRHEPLREELHAVASYSASAAAALEEARAAAAHATRAYDAALLMRVDTLWRAPLDWRPIVAAARDGAVVTGTWCSSDDGRLVPGSCAPLRCLHPLAPRPFSPKGEAGVHDFWFAGSALTLEWAFGSLLLRLGAAARAGSAMASSPPPAEAIAWDPLTAHFVLHRHFSDLGLWQRGLVRAHPTAVSYVTYSLARWRHCMPVLAEEAGDGEWDGRRACLPIDADCSVGPLVFQSPEQGPVPTVHLLHPVKSGGAALRAAIGCGCGGPKDECQSNEKMEHSAACWKTTSTAGGEFVCHGHEVTCADLPRGSIYALFTRDSRARVASCERYFDCKITVGHSVFGDLLLAKATEISRRTGENMTSVAISEFCKEQISDQSYEFFVGACPDNPPAFVGRFEEFESEYARLRATFGRQCESAGCAAALPARSARHVNRRRGEQRRSGDRSINRGSSNPSKLIPPRENNPACTHSLYRNPKTGSTSLYNAVQEDDALRKHVCWQGEIWHAEPPQDGPPIITALREPMERLASATCSWSMESEAGGEMMRYNKPQSLFVRGRVDDIVLCVGSKHPPVHEQLRAHFKDPDIRDVIVENESDDPRCKARVSDSELPEGIRRSMDEDRLLWEQYCG